MTFDDGGPHERTCVAHFGLLTNSRSMWGPHSNAACKQGQRRGTPTSGHAHFIRQQLKPARLPLARVLGIRNPDSAP